MHFYCFTTSGLEGVTCEEIYRRLEGAYVEGREEGVVYFAYEGRPEPLLELATTEDVFALVARGEVALERAGLGEAETLVRAASGLEEGVELYRRLKPKRGKRVTYRVVVQRRGGKHGYIRQELGKRISRAVGERFRRWKRVEDDALVEIWGLQRGMDLLCGLRLSDRTMRHRTYKKANIQASLRPIVARSMVLLAEPADDDVFLDPMCGAGTILIERGEHGRYEKLLGGDIRGEAVEAALTNIGPRYKPIEIREWDARRLPLADGSVTRIVCNLPFGKQIGSQEENRTLYGEFAAEGARVLGKGGVLVLLTSDRRLLERTLKGRPELGLERIWPIFVLGQRAYIFKARMAG